MEYSCNIRHQGQLKELMLLNYGICSSHFKRGVLNRLKGRKGLPISIQKELSITQTFICRLIACQDFLLNQS